MTDQQLGQPENIITGQHYRFTVLTSRMVRLEYSVNEHFEDHLTQIVQNRNLGEPEFEVFRHRNQHELEIVTDYFHLYYEGGPLTPDSLYIDTKYGYSSYNNRWNFGQPVETLKGTVRTLDKADGAVPLEEGLMSRNGYSVINDSHSFIIENDLLRPRTAAGDDWYYLAYGHDFFSCLQDYYRLTGFPSLLPRYALGNWWSRYHAYTQAEYQELFENFNRAGVPFSIAVLDIDWHLTRVPHRFGSGWTGYTWNRKLFPQPEKLLTWLHEHGKKVTLNLHPADGIRAFEEWYPTVAKRLQLDTAAEEPALFNLRDETFRKSYFEDVHHPLEKMGVDFWWIDWQQGTNFTEQQVDPLWLLNHYHFKDSRERHGEGLILSRYAGLGSHRYPVGFSGDTIVTWNSLAFQPHFTATATNIGYTWWSHDIGGHMHGIRDDELALRWLQFGVFGPIMRLHSSGNLFGGKEPQNYNQEIAEIMRCFLRLRHELIPYLDSANFETHTFGIPLVRPMYYHHDKPTAYELRNQAMFGSELLVAPIVKPKIERLDQSKVTMWFPEGQWFDFFTGLRYEGNVTLNVFRDNHRYPVFVRAGGIVPMNPHPLDDVMRLPQTLAVKIYPGADNKYRMYEHQDEHTAVTTFVWSWQHRRFTIKVDDPGNILPSKRVFQLNFIGVTPFKTHVDAAVKKCVTTHSNRIIFVQSNCAEFGATFSQMELVAQRDQIVERLFDKLRRAQIDFDTKELIWKKFLAAETKIQFISFLNTLTDQELATLLYEIVYLL